MTASARRLVGVVCLIQGLTGLHATAFTAFAGYLFRQTLGLDLTAASLLVSAALLVYGLAQLVAGLFLDLGVRLAGRRNMLLRVCMLSTFGWGGVIFAPRGAVVLAGVLLLGLGAASLPLALAVLADHTPQDRRGRFSGLLSAAVIAGQLLALGLGWLVVGGGHAFRYFLGVCLLWAVAATVSFFVLPKGERIIEPALRRIVASRIAESARSLGGALLDPATRAIKINVLLTSVAPILAGAYVSLRMLQLAHDPAHSALAIALSTAIGYVVGLTLAPALGSFSDRRQNKGLLLLISLLGLTVALGAAASAQTLVAVAAANVVAVTLFQWLAMFQNALVLTLAGTEGTTTFFAANLLPNFVGFPMGVGLAFVTIQATGSVGDALWLVAALCLAGATAWAGHLATARRAPRLREAVVGS